MLIIIEENAMRNGQYDQNAEDSDVGVIEIYATFQKILRLLVGTEQELLVDVVYEPTKTVLVQ